ncbi:serine/threonine protein kinase [Prosthecobacter fusiformis]|uniref:Serine/threonine protein kinase n=1 Tax=Prosthecobacter fusiformis TaxID=48464 RepID=A0A4V3FEC7_9BACT|nr:serine/threonine-protein kinase [Prosthecobacter fusiformis]TDU64270.1 serine/threonine protein kinase [Prosthecobacter fusiformis]
MSDSPPDDLPPQPSPAEGGPSYPSLEELSALLPQYEFQQVIGIGGMGAVYLAQQPQLERWVAVKVLPVAAATNPEDADRFNKEARSMARLSHPNIVAVFDYGQTEAGHLYLAMEYVQGADLHWRTRAGEVTPERARLVIAQLCDALQYAHEHSVIHRDIKPANILITPDWQVKVVDFGLAKDLTLDPDPEESEYGTPDYTAPERLIIGAPVDHRADIYSLGVVIHEILTGKTPLAAGAEAGKGLPEGFAGVLSKCLMRDPARRFQKASEVRTALLAATSAAKKKAAIAPVNPPTASKNAFAPRPQPPRPPVPAASENSWVGTVGWALACLVTLGGLGWLVWRDHYIAPQEKQTVPALAMAGAPSPVQPATILTADVQPVTPSPVSAAIPDLENTSAEISNEMQANIEPGPDVIQQSPTMNKAIPTALALAASTVSALSVDYQSQIMPIFKAKCYECHSEEKGKEKGKVALDTEAKLKATIGPGQHIIPGEPEKSTMLLICKLPNDDDDVMPPKGKNRLTPEEVTLLETWIKEGANLAGGSAAPMAATPPAAPSAAATTWTSSDGKSIEATFVSLVGDQITLRLTATGANYTFPLSRLSADSQTQAKTAAGM